MTRIPNTTTVASYAYTVKANGSVIGTVQGFNPSANRNLERVREILNEIDDVVENGPDYIGIIINPSHRDFEVPFGISRFIMSSPHHLAIQANDDPPLDFSQIVITSIVIKYPVGNTQELINAKPITAMF